MNSRSVAGAVPRDRLAEAMKKHGLTITARFVPWSQSRTKDEKETDYSGKPTDRPRRSLNWRATVSKTLVDGYTPQDRPILTTDYGAGIGYCPAYRASVKLLGNASSVIRQECIAWECEHGKPASWFNNTAGVAFSASRAPIMPDPCDVMHSLLLDANVLDAGTFEEWASEYGYDPDSRKAEAIYRACLEIALKLRNGLGETVMAELREAAQNY